MEAAVNEATSSSSNGDNGDSSGSGVGAKFHFALFTAYDKLRSSSNSINNSNNGADHRDLDHNDYNLDHHAPSPSSSSSSSSAWSHLVMANEMEFQRHVKEQQYYERKQVGTQQPLDLCLFLRLKIKLAIDKKKKKT
jgi:hypothetical protein